MNNKNSCDYCGARPGSDCSGYGLTPGQQHNNRSNANLLTIAVPLLLAACERVLERWETHDGQMNNVDDIRAAVAITKAHLND